EANYKIINICDILSNVETVEFDDEVFDGKAFDSEAFNSKTFGNKAFDSEAFVDEAFDGEAFDNKVFDGEEFDGGTFGKMLNEDVEVLKSDKIIDEALNIEEMPSSGREFSQYIKNLTECEEFIVYKESVATN
ncbi:19458_t:CDS:2, partial [Racocetra fulgida]